MPMTKSSTMCLPDSSCSVCSLACSGGTAAVKECHEAGDHRQVGCASGGRHRGLHDVRTKRRGPEGIGVLPAESEGEARMREGGSCRHGYLEMNCGEY